mmetsp:Transcript_28901/g.76372  ORF Transcript_28901/g.76372 Transcript_28901/m.76372 type:complete len:340 (-) Transcript_28901:103-1122(-)
MLAHGILAGHPARGQANPVQGPVVEQPCLDVGPDVGPCGVDLRLDVPRLPLQGRVLVPVDPEQHALEEFVEPVVDVAQPDESPPHHAADGHPLSADARRQGRPPRLVGRLCRVERVTSQDEDVPGGHRGRAGHRVQPEVQEPQRLVPDEGGVEGRPACAGAAHRSTGRPLDQVVEVWASVPEGVERDDPQGGVRRLRPVQDDVQVQEVLQAGVEDAEGVVVLVPCPELLRRLVGARHELEGVPIHVGTHAGLVLDAFEHGGEPLPRGAGHALLPDARGFLGREPHAAACVVEHLEGLLREDPPHEAVAFLSQVPPGVAAQRAAVSGRRRRLQLEGLWVT